MKKLIILLVVISSLSACHKDNAYRLNPLQDLEQGNKRFVAGKPAHDNASPARIKELKNGQHPVAVVISCSDSRVPPEMVFDQGLGDIFSIRTAGHVIGDFELGSIEYAVEHLHCSLVVVLGHQDCGAIKAFIEAKGSYKQMDHIKSIVDYIQNEVEEKNLITSNTLLLDKAVEANIHHAVNVLKSSRPVISQMYYANKIQIVGAIYDIESGRVVFYE